MSQNRRERRAADRLARNTNTQSSASTARVTSSTPDSNRHFSFWLAAGVLVLGMLLGVGVHWLVAAKPIPSPKCDKINNPMMTAPSAIGNDVTLWQLVSMSDAQLAGMDVAVMNLACAEGLPGRGSLSAQQCVEKLEEMTAAVSLETARHMDKFRKNPGAYENSEEFFRVLMLNTVLGQDFGVRYNPKKISAATRSDLNDLSFFEEGDDIFLSGVLGSSRMGTCASMPVLCVAVGRRLGYPLKLATAKTHLFFRWDDGSKRMNFECTNGIECPPDSHYRQWPFPISDKEMSTGIYLRSLTPREELAEFIASRALVFKANKNDGQALLGFAQANAVKPATEYQTQIMALAAIARSRSFDFTRPTDGNTHSRPANAGQAAQAQRMMDMLDGIPTPQPIPFTPSKVQSSVSTTDPPSSTK